MITIGQARRILMEWHGGQGTAVYSVGSTGKVNMLPETIEELEADRRSVAHDPGRWDDNGLCDRELAAVIEWLRSRRSLGSVPRDVWLAAWDDTPVDDDEDAGCPGHESLSGGSMGESVFCDGSCSE